jgi:cytochrome c peroxidase
VIGLLACAEPPWTDRERLLIEAMSPIPAPAPRPTNRHADDPTAAALGARLFTDTGFSANGEISCATCHDPARAFTDGLPVATTTFGTGTRNTPTIRTAAWSTWYFWDGRADSAWAQAAGPLTNPIEHAFDAARVRDRVLAGYAEEWALFGGVSDDPERVLVEVGKAIEAFERTQGHRPARFDRWVAEGLQSDLMTEEEQRGLRRFLADPGCVACHNGPLFTDHQFHTLGLPSSQGEELDFGRAVGVSLLLEDPRNCLGPYSDAGACDELRYLDPSFPDWLLAFKTPSLRDVALTAPYMHGGEMSDLDAVLGFYGTLPGTPKVGHRELTLRPLDLDHDERAELVAFLGTLTSD